VFLNSIGDFWEGGIQVEEKERDNNILKVAKQLGWITRS
jgi:hypothetical protein